MDFILQSVDESIVIKPVKKITHFCQMSVQRLYWKWSFQR